MNQVYELKKLHAQLHRKLLSQAESSEASVMAMWLLEHYLAINRADFLLNQAIEVSTTIRQQLEDAVDRLNRHEPIQYVLGEAYFYGRKFTVSPDVLIPRRETEELVAWVKKENPEAGLRVLDIGTGSGCIGITLGLEMNCPRVFAFDINEAAVQVATENAALNRAEVTFWVANLLYDELIVPRPFDIIVSNPPYVRRSEASHMSARVLQYEPEEALFVDNQHPLLFYQRMVFLCQRKGWLAQGGKIYWEINEAMGTMLLPLLQDNGFIETNLRSDMQGKPRFVTGKLAE